MVSTEKMFGYAIVSGVVFALVYKIITTTQPVTATRGMPVPTETVGGVSYVPYPTPYPTMAPEESGEEYPTEGPTQEDSMNLALNYVMTQPPYTTLSCTSPVCTDVDTLRTLYAWRFKFEFTCDPLAVVRVAYVTVINGTVTDFSVTP